MDTKGHVKRQKKRRELYREVKWLLENVVSVQKYGAFARAIS